jgi:hypothetical protein
MRPFVVKFFPVVTEPPLLFFHRHEGVALFHRTFQGAVHSLMAAIFFRMPLSDTLRPDAQLD